MSDKLIDYEDIMQTIRNNFAEVMDEDENYYYGYNVQITDEQQFLRIKEAQHDTIFMVVKFGASTTFYGASVVPITISAISENNHCFICQRLLTDYAQKFNLADYGKDSVQQIYETPSVSLNFNEVYSGFRSVLTLSGTFVIAKNISFYNFIYNYKDEKGNDKQENLRLISSYFDYNGNIDSQAFFGTHNFAESVSKVASLSCGFSCYIFSDSQLIKDCMKIVALAGEDGISVTDNINNKFSFTISFNDSNESSFNPITCNFKLINLSCSREVANIPMIGFSFAK